MKTCARCNESIAGEGSVNIRRKDGSPAVLCSNCVTELRAKRNENRSQQDSGKRAAHKGESGERWYKTLGTGLLFIVFGIFVFMQLSRLEAGDIHSARLWWPIAVLYQLLGFWGAISCPGILAILFLGLGVKQFVTAELSSGDF